jgi:membrane-associated phospholipid phosphatase
MSTPARDRSAGAAKAIEAFDFFDGKVSGWFDRHLRGRELPDRIMYGASALGDQSLIWSMLALSQRLRRPSDDRAADIQLIRAIAGIAIESALVNGPVKWMFRRSRPITQRTRPHHLHTPRSSSFPSGHATSGFCAAALLRDNDPMWPLYYTAALVVAWSRVHVDIHHPSDVVAGMALGMILGELARRLVPLPG